MSCLPNLASFTLMGCGLVSFDVLIKLFKFLGFRMLNINTRLISWTILFIRKLESQTHMFDGKLTELG